MTRIILTRHGQTVWNLERRVQGSLDSPLTEKGIRQAQALAARLKDEQIEYIYTSDSKRAISTAEEICRVLGFDKLGIHFQPDLREFSFGEWEGQYWQELRETKPDVFQIWDSQPYRVTPPGGENMELVTKRAWNILQQIIDRHPGETVCIVTHGLTLKMLVTKALGLGVDCWAETPWQDNTALNIFEVVEGRWQPLLLGDCAHLAELEDLAEDGVEGSK